MIVVASIAIAVDVAVAVAVPVAVAVAAPATNSYDSPDKTRGGVVVQRGRGKRRGQGGEGGGRR